MVRRWCIPLAGAALVIGSLAAAAPASAAGRVPHAPAAGHQIRPGGRMIRPGSPLAGPVIPQVVGIHAVDDIWDGPPAAQFFQPSTLLRQPCTCGS